MSDFRFADTSKQVGWVKPIDPVVYPSENQVQAAIENQDMYSLLRWNRFLPSPSSDPQIRILSKIMGAMSKLKRQWDREDRTFNQVAHKKGRKEE